MNVSLNINQGSQLPKDNLIPMARHGGNSTFESYAIRDTFCKYFSSREVQVKWQLSQVTGVD